MTPVGRNLILGALLRRGRVSRSANCIVWSEDECTFVMADGSTIDSKRPPHGEPVYPEDYEHVHAEVLDVRYVRMPDDSETRFLCVRTLGRGRVEISSGSPMILGHFDELPFKGPGSELRRHLNEKGELIAPTVFRGITTTGVENGYTLVGPVQPDGEAIRVVEPWPQTVLAAAEEIAGIALPPSTRDAVWRAVDPMKDGMILVGCIEIA